MTAMKQMVFIWKKQFSRLHWTNVYQSNKPLKSSQIKTYSKAIQPINQHCKNLAYDGPIQCNMMVSLHSCYIINFLWGCNFLYTFDYFQIMQIRRQGDSKSVQMKWQLFFIHRTSKSKISHYQKSGTFFRVLTGGITIKILCIRNHNA